MEVLYELSTTVLQLCNCCPTDIEVFSNSLNNVTILDKRACSVNIIGGKLNHDNKFIYGYDAIEQIGKVHYDIAFLGADGIITNSYPGRDVEKMLEKKEVNLIIAG